MAAKPKETAAPTVALIDDPDAPVVFATELPGGGPCGTDFVFTFAVLQHDHSHTPPRAYRKVCLRLVLPPHTAAGAAQFIKDVLAQSSQGPFIPANQTVQ